jgi:hypothetical protein
MLHPYMRLFHLHMRMPRLHMRLFHMHMRMPRLHMRMLHLHIRLPRTAHHALRRPQTSSLRKYRRDAILPF